ncbi:GntR family transcriptional regulator [Cellulomonas sp. URHB0016]
MSYELSELDFSYTVIHVTAERPADRAHLAFLSLRSAIVEAALPPGTRLPEDVIAAQYGVSRTLVRSTLARLTAAGLVTTGVAKSAMVANPSIDEAKATFEVRRCLEREAVRLASGRMAPEEVERLRAHVHQEAAAADAGDARVSGRLGAEFHLLLGELCRNELLDRYLSEVVWRCALILSVHGHVHDQRRSIDEHRRLIDLLAAGSADEAGSLVDAHVSAVEDRALAAREAPQKLDLVEVLSRY